MSKNKKEELNEALKAHLIEAIKKLVNITEVKRSLTIDAIKDERTVINPKQLREFCPLLFTNGVIPKNDSKILEAVIKKYEPKKNTAHTFATSEPAPTQSTPKSTPKKPRQTKR